MYFQQTWMLWGLLAASIPVIIHLLNRRRHKTVKWAAMQFLLKATRESRGKKRLRHILILICRTLGIAALVAAASLPLVGGFFGMGAGKPDLVVLVLDRSASMEAKPENSGLSRRALAIQRIRDAVADLSGTRLVLIDSASGAPQEVPTPEVLGELSSTAATDSAADLPDLLTTAANFLAETPGRAELWVASDLQLSNWLPEDDRWTRARASLESLPQPPRVRVLAVSGESAGNQSLRILSSRRNGDRLELELEIARNGPALSPLGVPVTTTLNGARSTDSVTVTGQQLRFLKTLPTPETDESGFGWISIPGDGNPRDNVAYFAYGPALPVTSGVVAQPGEAADYLSLAAAPDGFGGQTSERIGPDALSGKIVDETAALFWAAPLPAGPIAERLEQFVRDGGQLLVFPPDTDADTEFLGITWSEIQNAPSEQFFILDSWDRADGLLRDGIDGTPVPADRLRAVKRRIPQGDASILARWDDTEPFMVRQVIGKGTAWFIGSLPDYSWSNLGDADVLLPLAQRAVVAGAVRFDSGYLTRVGASDSLPAPNETRERFDSYADASTAQADHIAGVYRLGDRVRAVNRPASEDLAGQIETPAVSPLFEGLSFSLFEDTSSSARDNISRSVWRAFLIAMLFFLLAEALLCLPKAMPRIESPTAGAQPSTPR
ncbi:BatA domain-containing protein [Haloferula sp. A504]|uniref:vWA domain-containing protein n=1 Tax=Haloferula sp. A504 TaxID=3373601 RepID=UPI0031C2F92C|nr:BatA domain-containing protein [Verrucomicrobiaceae bacterium E54]